MTNILERIAYLLLAFFITITGVMTIPNINEEAKVIAMIYAWSIVSSVVYFVWKASIKRDAKRGKHEE